MYIGTQMNFSNLKVISLPTVHCLFRRCLYFFHLTELHMSPHFQVAYNFYNMNINVKGGIDEH